MTDLNREKIRKLANLCRISCTEEEEEHLSKDLENIVEYVALLQQEPTEGIPPCHHVLSPTQNVFRDDIPGKTIPKEDYLANAPDQIGGMVRIPTLIKKGNSRDDS